MGYTSKKPYDPSKHHLPNIPPDKDWTMDALAARLQKNADSQYAAMVENWPPLMTEPLTDWASNPVADKGEGFPAVTSDAFTMKK